MVKKKDGNIYTDQTGNFQVHSNQGTQYMFIAYDYRSNTFFDRALQNQKDASLLEAFKDVYQKFMKSSFRLKLNAMDNQCSQKIQQFIQSTKANIQRINPNDHQVNAAKGAIQTWKNHWLVEMGILDPNSPMQLWCQFLEQGQDTLNLLQTSRVNPKLSAYAVLEGQFIFNQTPLAPVGTKSKVFITPNKQNTCENHAVDTWYVGPAKMNYRNYKIYIPETRGYRITSSAIFFSDKLQDANN